MWDVELVELYMHITSKVVTQTGHGASSGPVGAVGSEMAIFKTTLLFFVTKMIVDSCPLFLLYQKTPLLHPLLWV
jgi:hypothetical protein